MNCIYWRSIKLGTLERRMYYLAATAVSYTVVLPMKSEIARESVNVGRVDIYSTVVHMDFRINGFLHKVQIQEHHNIVWLITFLEHVALRLIFRKGVTFNKNCSLCTRHTLHPHRSIILYFDVHYACVENYALRWITTLSSPSKI